MVDSNLSSGGKSSADIEHFFTHKNAKRTDKFKNLIKLDKLL